MFYLRFLGFSRNIKAKAKSVIETQNRDTVDKYIWFMVMPKKQIKR